MSKRKKLFCFLFAATLTAGSLIILWPIKSQVYAYYEDPCKPTSVECYTEIQCRETVRSYCWTWCAWRGEECEEYWPSSKYCALWSPECVCFSTWQIVCTDGERTTEICWEDADECYNEPQKK